MQFGRTIRIYLQDGSVTGIRHSEIVNWSGQAVFFPRSKIKELDEWDEAKKPGVYFLFGLDENSNSAAVYIGESENILTRLNQHLKNKEFWNEAVFFTSKDDNLTKSHIKYLEARLIEEGIKANRYKLVNGNEATLSSLPRSDRDAMEEFLNNIRILLGTMGHKVLEPIHNFTVNEKNTYIEFKLKGRVPAYSIYSNEGIIVKRGSKVYKESKPSMHKGPKELKEKLISEEILISADDDFYEFSQDYLFSSSSYAATVILGSPCSGPQNWIKIDDNITLKEFEANKDK